MRADGDDADGVNDVDDDERSFDAARLLVPFKWLLLLPLIESTVESVNDLERDNSQFDL